ncbi:dTDP-4-amino-4,6-dideoxyglucose [Amycolatopsis marina]|uniref:dTDP-4-amino-4,6-dideoxyglucose n=1 Tax=Amycolatopsis marina TaxID=490629 RepID=A0A1I0ZKK8_9PSEU|nr:aminotransferase class I/II-fold pyridoxal phosphate-dependent enzyme [Amycolatopsis marina]SFB25892.1 dTDP-4-amino-4,6-dideoxyglucose [Amycolatopsis marina]
MKHVVADLALFGGRPAFLTPLHTNRPNRFDRARLFDRLDWALDNQWLSNGGPLVLEFEQRVAELAGVEHCVATCNATVALQLLMHGADLSGEVIMPSLTFSATAHAARWIGLEPVFCDIDPATGCIDPAAIADAVTPQTSAVIGVHLWGRTCAVDELEKVAADNGLPVFFDAAHGIGCSSAGRTVGGFGAAEVFSFHATKVVSAFEGGAVVTDDARLADRIRALHNFGKGIDHVSDAGGTNGKMSEAAAAMGLTSLDAFDSSVRHNRANYDAYREELDEVDGITFFNHETRERNNFQYVIIELDEAETGISRDLLLDVLKAENAIALTPIGSPACHQLEPYRSRRPVRLPHTEKLVAGVISLPSGSTVSREDIRRVCALIRFAVTHSTEVTSRRKDSQ